MTAISTQRLTSRSAIHAAIDWVTKIDDKV